MSKNEKLRNAKSGKKDEFYTPWDVIENEMNTYREHNSDVFRGKTLLLPCDNPEWSNFTKYFALYFKDLGLKKVISTSYTPLSKGGEEYSPSSTIQGYPQYDPEKELTNGKISVLDGIDHNEDGIVNIQDVQWEYLEGDGDFRSEEVTKLRDEADIVITNPPFSLFREFMAWVIEGDVKFSVIGNMNAVTYKEIFPLFQSGKCWYGPYIHGGCMEFRIPDR